MYFLEKSLDKTIFVFLTNPSNLCCKNRIKLKLKPFLFTLEIYFTKYPETCKAKVCVLNNSSVLRII